MYLVSLSRALTHVPPQQARYQLQYALPFFRPQANSRSVTIKLRANALPNQATATAQMPSQSPYVQALSDINTLSSASTNSIVAATATHTLLQPTPDQPKRLVAALNVRCHFWQAASASNKRASCFHTGGPRACAAAATHTRRHQVMAQHAKPWYWPGAIAR